MLHQDSNNKSNNSSFQDDNSTFHLSKFHNFTIQNASTMSSSSSSAAAEQGDWIAGVYYAVANYMYIVGSPLLTIVGTATNLLTLVIMFRKSFRSTSVAVYLSAAATSDSLVLIADLLNNWWWSAMHVRLMGLSNPFCLFHRFFLSFAYTYSAWIVTTLCVERFIVVWFPFRAKAVCNRRTAVITVFVLPILISAIQMYNFFAWYANGTACVMKEGGWTYFQSEYGQWISGLTYSYLPSIVMLVLNALIVSRLTVASRLRRKMALEATTSEKKEVRVTVTIVIISVLYVTMTVPCAVYFTVAFHVGQFTSYSPQFAVVRSVIILVALTSYVANFFLYVLNSSAFRKELNSLLCGCRGGGKGGTASSFATASSYATGISTVSKDGGGKGGGAGGIRKSGGAAVPKTGFSAIAVGGGGEAQVAPGAANPSSAASEMTF